jgi:hypothetical protein
LLKDQGKPRKTLIKLALCMKIQAWPFLSQQGLHRNTSPLLQDSCYVRVCRGDHVIAIEPLPNIGRCLESHNLGTTVALFIYFAVIF